MEPMPHKTHTTHTVPPDVKKEILEKAKQGDKPIQELAQDYGITDRCIYRWLSTGATASPTWNDYHKLKRENQVLLGMIGKLIVEKNVMGKKTIGR